MVGRTISRHRILGKLGESGMGVVCLAEKLGLERAVARQLLPGVRDAAIPPFQPDLVLALSVPTLARAVVGRASST